jgi:hypothetical protein
MLQQGLMGCKGEKRELTGLEVAVSGGVELESTKFAVPDTGTCDVPRLRPVLGCACTCLVIVVRPERLNNSQTLDSQHYPVFKVSFVVAALIFDSS